MKYINKKALSRISPKEFNSTKPYPWWNPQGFLTDKGLGELEGSLPPLEQLDTFEGVERVGGQKPHDRYVLEYEKGTKLSPPWQEFINELKAEEYRGFVSKMLGQKDFIMRFHWHYATSGQSVSPHVDGKRKLGSHIFYFNTPENWKEEWGGQTIVLHDLTKHFPFESAPEYEDFDDKTVAKMLGNYSFLFKRTKNCWHGVKPIHAPEGHLRKIFIVVFDKAKPDILVIARNKLRKLFR